MLVGVVNSLRVAWASGLHMCPVGYYILGLSSLSTTFDVLCIVT